MKDSSASSPGRKRSPASRSFTPKDSSDKPKKRLFSGPSSGKPPGFEGRKDSSSEKPAFRSKGDAGRGREFSKPFEKGRERTGSDERPKRPFNSSPDKRAGFSKPFEKRDSEKRDDRPKRDFNSADGRKSFGTGSGGDRGASYPKRDRPERSYNSDRRQSSEGSESRGERPKRTFSNNSDRKPFPSRPFSGPPKERREDGKSWSKSEPRDEKRPYSDRAPERRSSGTDWKKEGEENKSSRPSFSKAGSGERRQSGPRVFGVKSPGDRYSKRLDPKGDGEPEKRIGRKRIGQKDDSGKVSRLGQQAPTQVKSFRRMPDAPSAGKAPDYDPKRIEKKPFKAKEKGSNNDYTDLIRLNRYIAQAGLCSRREADVLIASGQITVNGVVVDQMGYNVKKDDIVKYGKRLLNREKLVYVLLNKPKDFLTTTEDPEERKTVMNLVENACEERIYPVGRLDRNTTGLLLLTNDGELSEKLMHPSHNIKKIYQVDLDKPLIAADEAKIREGVELEDGLAPVDELEVLSKERDIVGLSIHLGRNRIVRRIFESLGYKVEKLDRVMYAGLTKKDLPRGNWRFLSEKEVVNLKYFS